MKQNDRIPSLFPFLRTWPAPGVVTVEEILKIHHPELPPIAIGVPERTIRTKIVYLNPKML